MFLYFYVLTISTYTALPDGAIPVEAEAAREMARRSAREAGVLGFHYDTGERYLSIDGFLPTE